MNDALTRAAMLSILASMAKSFLITEAIEIPLGWVLGVRDRKGILLVFLANLMTNPASVFIYCMAGLFLGSKAALAAAVPIEVAVLLAEWKLYFARPNMLDADRLVFARPGKDGSREISTLLLSLILNAASYCLGTLF